MKHPISAYEKRIDDEIRIIQGMKYPGYFLIVWDLIRYARENDIPVGPGRGSAAGSMASYCMRITDIDPIQYGLLFERFLNPERISLPDIDIDFCMNRRGEVIDYVTKKYGRENVCQIITFGTMAARGVHAGHRPGNGNAVMPKSTRSQRWCRPNCTSRSIKPSSRIPT